MLIKEAPEDFTPTGNIFWCIVYVVRKIRISDREAMDKHGHDDVSKWKHFPRYWPFVRGIHQWPVNSPHKGQWRGALMFSLICAWLNGWVNNREAVDLRCHRAHHDVIVMQVQHRTSPRFVSWTQISWTVFCSELISQLSNPFEIICRQRQYRCRALWKTVKSSRKWNGCN